MNIDEGLAQRVRETLLELADFADISERKMFGALMTMVNGHMTCGISGAKSSSKIRPQAHTDAATHSDTVLDSGLVLRVGAPTRSTNPESKTVSEWVAASVCAWGRILLLDLAPEMPQVI